MSSMVCDYPWASSIAPEKKQILLEDQPKNLFGLKSYTLYVDKN